MNNSFSEKKIDFQNLGEKRGDFLFEIFINKNPTSSNGEEITIKKVPVIYVKSKVI